MQVSREVALTEVRLNMEHTYEQATPSDACARLSPRHVGLMVLIAVLSYTLVFAAFAAGGR